MYTHRRIVPKSETEPTLPIGSVSCCGNDRESIGSPMRARFISIPTPNRQLHTRACSSIRRVLQSIVSMSSNTVSIFCEHIGFYIACTVCVCKCVCESVYAGTSSGVGCVLNGVQLIDRQSRIKATQYSLKGQHLSSQR